MNKEARTAQTCGVGHPEGTANGHHEVQESLVVKSAAEFVEDFMLLKPDSLSVLVHAKGLVVVFACRTENASSVSKPGKLERIYRESYSAFSSRFHRQVESLFGRSVRSSRFHFHSLSGSGVIFIAFVGE